MTVDVRRSAPAHVFSFGFGFALAAFFLELAVPFTTSRVAGALDPSAFDVGGYIAGAALRFPLSVLVFALLAYPTAESTRPSARMATFGVGALVLFVEGVSYRFLGREGVLLSFRGVLFPLRAFAPMQSLVALLGAAAGTALARRVVRYLEPRFATRYAREFTFRVDFVSLFGFALMSVATSFLGARAVWLGATPPVAAWFFPVRAPAPTQIPSEAATPAIDAEGVVLPPADVIEVVHATQALRTPEELTDGAHPYCRERRPTRVRGETPRSVVLLVVRGVGYDAIAGDSPAFPSLARLAASSLSFEHAIAGADDPTQGLVQILSGVSPLAPTRYRELASVPRLPSLPEALGSLGIATRYVSTRDLSIGRERRYLAGLGFEAVLEPSFADEGALGEAFGADERTVDRVIATLESTRTAPRFVVAPLSSALDAAPGLGIAPGDSGPAESSARARHAAIDAALARFLVWFDAHERANGTVLVVVGDSGTRDGERASPDDTRFEVPFVLSNLRAVEQGRGRERAATGVRVGLLDVADTVLGLVGQPAVGCFQGRDLLAPREPIPTRRRLLSFAGPDQGLAVVHDGRIRWQIPRSAIHGPFEVFDVVADRALAHDLFDANDAAVPFIREQILTMLGIGRYLEANDRFVDAPPSPNRAAVSAPDATQQASTLAPSPGAAGLVGALTARRRAGFEAISIAVSFDPTLTPVLGGKPLAEGLRALARPLGTATLVLDLVLDPRGSERESIAVARAVARAIAAASIPNPMVILSRDPTVAMSLGARTTYDVYVHLPSPSPELARAAAGFGVDGIVFDAEHATGLVVRHAHALGLRVALGDVDSMAAIDAFGSDRPDVALVSASRPLR